MRGSYWRDADLSAPRGTGTSGARSAVALRLGLGLVALSALVGGWWLFWFLTDDAYIEFRYASNLLAGRGLVWNPAPFRPVEGYTSFAWVVLLAGVWAVTGVAPPQSANVLSLAFAAGTTAIAWWMVERMPLPGRHARLRLLYVALVLAGTLSNRTWLAWTSSGLETAMFNLCFVGWIAVAAARPERRSAAWPWALSLLATLAALTRPDGLLTVLATPALVLAARRPAVALLPLLGVAAHLVGRRLAYGLWLPNTWYAKVVAPWPEAGWRYLASFVLEYGVVVLALGAVAWVAVAVRRGDRPSLHLAVPIAVVAGHVGYYVLRVGGDHFEFRPFSYLVPLLFVASVGVFTRLVRRPEVAVAAILLFVVAAQPIPWTHWRATHHRLTREQTHHLTVKIARRFPAALRPPVQAWDELQAWLIRRYVCMRHQEHKVFGQHAWTQSPTREDGAKIGRRDHPIRAEAAVGVVGWALPDVAIIDLLGLNDRVIASTPVQDASRRRMAHERRVVPAGYLECLSPNVHVHGVEAHTLVREVPLTSAMIRACEERFWPE